MAAAAPPATADTTILAHIRSALNTAFGDRLERAVLYGSRARGDADRRPITTSLFSCETSLTGGQMSTFWLPSKPT